MSSVPTGVWVAKAVYSMYFFKGEFTGVNCSLFTYSRPWNVSTSNWNQADSGIAWTSPGGDYRRDFMAWTPFADINSWESFDVTEIVRDFLQNPDSSFGFFLLTGYNNIERRYYSSEYEVDSLRPKLTITTSTGITNKNSKPHNTNGIQIKSAAKLVSFSVPLKDDYTISILDIKGRQIYVAQSEKIKSHLISLKNQSMGVYFLQIKGINSFSGRKFFLK